MDTDLIRDTLTCMDDSRYHTLRRLAQSCGWQTVTDMLISLSRFSRRCPRRAA